MMTSSNGNIFRVTGPLCGEFTGPRKYVVFQWALMFTLVCAWINGWVNNRETGDLIRHRARYEVYTFESFWYTVDISYQHVCNNNPMDVSDLRISLKIPHWTRWNSPVSTLHFRLGYSAGAFRALWIVALAVFRAVNWLIALSMSVHFLQIYSKEIRL